MFEHPKDRQKLPYDSFGTKTVTTADGKPLLFVKG